MAMASCAVNGRADENANDSRPKVWNPMAAGPQLVSSAGVQAAGQTFVRIYGFSELAYSQYGDAWAARTHSLDRKLTVLNPQIEIAYGVLPWLEVGAFTSEASWWQSSGEGATAANGHGFGDTTPYFKLRVHVQQPDDWVPWMTNMFFAALPTSDWSGPIGTPPIPGGFAPLGRLPATHFGAPELTDALLFRKNVRPFRISGGIYYSYAVPGAAGQYFGDIVQYRLVFEHFLDEKKGFAYAIEGVGLHGMPFRLDGRTVNAGRSSFGLIGVQPSIEYNFTARIVGGLGVLFTALGVNDVTAVYPNASIYYYWSSSGGPVVGR